MLIEPTNLVIISILLLIICVLTYYYFHVKIKLITQINHLKKDNLKGNKKLENLYISLKNINKLIIEKNLFITDKEEKLSVILNNTVVGICIISLDKYYTYVNSVWIDMLDYKAEEFLQMNCNAVIHPKDIELSEKSFIRLKSGDTDNYQIEKRFITKSGKEFWGNVSASAIHNHEGKIEAIIEVIIDISKRKEAEAELFQIRYAIDNSSDAMVVNDYAGTAIYQNKSADNLFGGTIKEIVDFGEIANLMTDKTIVSQAYKAITKKGKWKGEFQISNKKNEMFDVSCSCDVLRDSEDKLIGLVSNYKNVTERKKSEQKLKEQYDEIQNKNQRIESSYKELNKVNNALTESEEKLQQLNATKDKFFSIVAHDLRNPFNALLNYSDILLSHFNEMSGVKIENLLSSIHQASKQGYNLLENLLDWSRSQTDGIEWKPEQLNLNELISTIIPLLESAASQKEITLAVNVSESLYVRADANMTKTVIRNLVSNAIKFSHKHGEIKINAKKIDPSFDKKIFVEISIIDSGVGISKENIAKLFRIDVSHSTTGTANEKGTGLGLILCKEFVEKHNGLIKVISSEGSGSSFVFTLPWLAEPLLSKKIVDNEIGENKIIASKNQEAIKKKDNINELERLVDFTEIEKLQLEIIIKQLKFEASPIYDKLNLGHRINDIKEFANKISDIGNQYFYVVLQKYGDDLYSFTENFDIYNLSRFVEFYPKLEAMLEKKIKNY